MPYITAITGFLAIRFKHCAALERQYDNGILQITYIGWVSERLPEEHFEDPRQRWEPRFIILKGGELCIFESPPVCYHLIFETV